MKKTETKETKKKHENLIFDGICKKAYFGKTKYDEEDKCRVTIYSELLPYNLITAYDDQPAKLTPAWFKDAEGYMNLNSGFDIPCMDLDGHEVTFREWVENNNTHNAVIRIKIRQKDGAVYPVAIKQMTEGEEIDNFADM